MSIPKTLAQARQNFDTSTAVIGQRYTEAVRRADWQTAAASDNAEANFATSMNRVIASKARQAAIRSVSNQDWQNAAATKGGAVIGERTRQGLDKWQARFGPIYEQVVASLPSLPPRSTDFRTNINNRLVRTVETWKRASGKL